MSCNFAGCDKRCHKVTRCSKISRYSVNSHPWSCSTLLSTSNHSGGTQRQLSRSLATLSTAIHGPAPHTALNGVNVQSQWRDATSTLKSNHSHNHQQHNSQYRANVKSARKPLPDILRLLFAVRSARACFTTSAQGYHAVRSSPSVTRTTGHVYLASANTSLPSSRTPRTSHCLNQRT